MSKERYKQLAIDAANKYGIDPTMFVAQIQQESAWNPTAVSSAGATGLAQIMPGTAKGLGISLADRNDPAIALDAGARYMAQLKKQFGGDEDLARMAYNWGPGNVTKWLDGKRSMPKETAEYNARIYKHAGATPTAFAAKPSVAMVGQSMPETSNGGKGKIEDPVSAPLMSQAPTFSGKELEALGRLAVGETTNNMQPGELLSQAAPTNPLAAFSGMKNVHVPTNKLVPVGVDGRNLNPEMGTIMGSLDSIRQAAADDQDQVMAMMFGSPSGNMNAIQKSIPRQVDRYIDEILG